MDELIAGFNAATTGTLDMPVEGSAGIRSQQLMHRQQVDVAQPMAESSHRTEQTTRRMLCLTWVITVATAIDLGIGVPARIAHHGGARRNADTL